MTFVKFRNEHFCVFAAHALPLTEVGLENIGMLATNGEFMPLSSVEKSHKICRKRDLVVCHTIGRFEYKNYFDLDLINSSTEFFENFSWIGFPAKKAEKNIHNTKASSEKIQEYISDGVDGLQKSTIAQFLLIGVELISITKDEVAGLYINKNVTYQHEGQKQQGYSLEGMSGGALFRAPKKINSTSSCLNDMFQFIGIGLEYQKEKIVKGASKNSVQELIDELLDTPCSS